MKFGAVSLDQAIGKLLAHNVIDNENHKLFGKGHVLTTADVDKLRDLNMSSVTVAELEADDVGENEAAAQIVKALANPNLKVSAPGVGRANVIAETRGVVYIDPAQVDRFNQTDEGITIATVRTHTVVKARQLIALVKVIPFAVPRSKVEHAASVAAAMNGMIWLAPLIPKSVALILSGPERAEAKLRDEFTPPVKTRVELLGSRLDAVEYVSHQPEAIAEAIQRRCKHDLIILAGISAIIDREDVAPTGLVRAGGHVEHFGAPVDPGSLTMLGYCGDVPVLGAPGCIKSLKVNIVDWIVPRLLVGEKLEGRQIMAMGHGGLLDDIEDRPMPREPRLMD
ncbi:MAG: molybdopterin-binding protein [Anaerolineae bacterium]|nr:molybdopterin-binding protein [Anaerolineae bacterium]